jgi:dihydrofolate reductase
LLSVKLRCRHGRSTAQWPTIPGWESPYAQPTASYRRGHDSYLTWLIAVINAWKRLGANSTVVSGDVKTELTKLKQDNNLGPTGSATLVRWLLEEGLVDELHLVYAPAGD